jgi:hypothetical protein
MDQALIDQALIIKMTEAAMWRDIDHWHQVAVMRRVLLRMSSWMNYVFLEH